MISEAVFREFPVKNPQEADHFWTEPSKNVRNSIEEIWWPYPGADFARILSIPNGDVEEKVHISIIVLLLPVVWRKKSILD